MGGKKNKQDSPDLDNAVIIDFPDAAFGETDDDHFEILTQDEGEAMADMSIAERISDNPVQQETKPGVQTTEFWVTIFANVLGILQLSGIEAVDAIGQSQNKYVLIALAIANGLYTVGRGMAKQGIPYTGK